MFIRKHILRPDRNACTHTRSEKYVHEAKVKRHFKNEQPAIRATLDLYSNRLPNAVRLRNYDAIARFDMGSDENTARVITIVCERERVVLPTLSPVPNTDTRTS